MGLDHKDPLGGGLPQPSLLHFKYTPTALYYIQWMSNVPQTFIILQLLGAAVSILIFVIMLCDSDWMNVSLTTILNFKQIFFIISSALSLSAIPLFQHFWSSFYLKE